MINRYCIRSFLRTIRGSISSCQAGKALSLFGAIIVLSLLLFPQIATAENEKSERNLLKTHSLEFDQLVYRLSDKDVGESAGSGIKKMIRGELRKKGFNILKMDDELFSTEAYGEAELVLGGTVRELKCQGDFEMACRITITWELYDRKAGSVVYEVSTSSIQTGVTYQSAKQRLHGLIKGALDSLLGREEFVALLESENGRQPRAEKVTDSDLSENATVVKRIAEPDAKLEIPEQNLKLDKKPPIDNKLMWSGIVTTLVGSATVIATYAIAKKQEDSGELTFDRLESLSTINAVGFCVGSIGLGLIVTSMILKTESKRAKQKESPGPVVRMGLSLHSATVKVSF